MINRAWTLSLAVACAVCGHPKQPSAEVQPGIFKEYTVYSKDRLNPGEYGDRVMVVFHGFGSAMPNGYYYRLYEMCGSSSTVVGFNYDYFDVSRNLVEFDQFYRKYLAGKSLTFTGTSLGAFWADLLGSRYHAQQIVLVNPLVDPVDVMSLRLGEHFSEKRQEKVLVTEEKLAAYDGVRLERAITGERLVILTKDDEMLDYRVARNQFENAPNTTTVVFDAGGHSVHDHEDHPAWAAIETFLRKGTCGAR